MLPEKIIDVRSEEWVVSIMGKGETCFYLLATTVPSSIEPGHKLSADAIMFRPKKDANGLIAVRAVSVLGKQTFTANFFLPIKWIDGEPQIDVKKIWLPQGKLGQVNYDCVEAVIDGECFTSKREGTAINGKRFVPDPNLLLAYLHEDVPPQAVIDVAQDAVCEADVLAEAAELRKELKKVESERFNFYEELLRTGSDLKQLQNQCAAQLKILSYLDEKEKHLRESRFRMVAIIDGLLEPQKNKPWWSKKIREINDSIGKEMLI